MRFFANNPKLKNKLYFLHIPKTGGISISNTLEQISNQKILTLLGPILLDHLEQYPEWAKSNILVGHLGLLPLNYEYEYFTVLRDPLERLYSHYSHIKREEGHYYHKILVEEKIDFEGYLRDKRFTAMNFNMQARYLSSYPKLGAKEKNGHHQELAKFFENSSEAGVDLGVAMNTLAKASWVGSSSVFQDLARFFEIRFGLSDLKIPILHVRQGPKKIFSTREIEAAEPLIEFDQILYNEWGRGRSK